MKTDFNNRVEIEDGYFYAIEVNNGNGKDFPVRNLYKFPEPEYRQSISMSAFFHGMKGHNWKCRNPEHLFYFQRPDEMHFMLDSDKRFYQASEIIQQYILINCESVYDFYDKIGFNRHTKKYQKMEK